MNPEEGLYVLEKDLVPEGGWLWKLSRYFRIPLAAVKAFPHFVKVLWKMDKVMTESVPYKITGEAKDNGWILRNRAQIESYMIDEMRAEGYIPVLDASSDLNVWFNAEKETFNYQIQLMAFHVGSAKSKKLMGVIAQQGLILGADSKTVSLANL